MPSKIRQFSMKILNKPEEISIALGKTAEGVTQVMYSVYDNQKEDLVKYILSQKAYEAVIIFASTKDKVKALYKVLRKHFDVEAFHSDLEQVDREKTMSAFKNKAVKILIGTDIISRGIDVVGIELVINFDTPGDPEDYVHRVGRTARADMEGEAITFVNPKDQQKFARIEKLIGMTITQNPLPESFEKGPVYSGDSYKSNRKFDKPKGEGSKGSSKGKKKFPQREKPQQIKPDHQKKSDHPKVQQTAIQNADPSSETQAVPSKASKYGKRKNVIKPE
jgi:superfamily II DNA/RNA helicase